MHPGLMLIDSRKWSKLKARLGFVHSGPRWRVGTRKTDGSPASPGCMSDNARTLIETGTNFQVRRHGEDARFEGSPIRVAANVLRDRTSDVLQPADLARRHNSYCYRVMMGPSFRADMWAALERDPTLSAAELARRTYGSFATAWHVKREFRLLSPASQHPKTLRRKPAKFA